MTTLTPSQLAQSAAQHFQNTIIDYPTWLNRVKNGLNGKPYDPSKTEWGKGFADLNTIVSGSASPSPSFGEGTFGEGNYGE